MPAIVDRHGAQHQMRTARELRQHGEPVLARTGLAEHAIAEQHLGIGTQHGPRVTRRANRKSGRGLLAGHAQHVVFA